MLKQLLKSSFSFFLIIAPLLGDEGYTVVSEKKYQVPDKQEMRTYEDVVLNCKKAGEVTLKNKANPVTIYEVLD